MTDPGIDAAARDTAPYVLSAPSGSALPLLFDSPHSGRCYPQEWRTPLSPLELRRGEDALVDRLIDGAPQRGITLLAAQLPRCYIDVNRDIDDIDPALLDGPWVGPPLRPSDKSHKGLGLIRRYVVPGKAIIDGPLSVADVRARIDNVYAPYHRALAQQQAALLARFGFVWHINWHSMKSRGNAMTPDGDGAPRPDMVVSDRDGTSAEARFVALVVAHLREHGFSVGVNDPYKGATIVRQYGQPSRGCSTIQIEMNRALYLDEIKVEPTPGFPRLKTSLESLMTLLATEAQRRVGKR